MRDVQTIPRIVVEFERRDSEKPYVELLDSGEVFQHAKLPGFTFDVAEFFASGRA